MTTSAAMVEITIHGRGGQGAQVAAQMLADALFRAGRYVQAFAAYGGERRGAPVTAFVRAADTPILVRCDIERADHVLVLDATLLARLAPESIRPDALVVVNGGVAPEGRSPLASRPVAVDASSIARRAGLGPIVATAMLGGFTAASELLGLPELQAAVEAGSPSKKRENVEACALAYAETIAALRGKS